MKKIEVKTGFGFFTDKNLHIISKSILPIGEHDMQDDFTYTEVADENALNDITVFQPSITQEQIDEKTIANVTRKLAIVEAKKLGLIDAGFTEPTL